MIKLLFIDMSKTLVKGSGANSGAEYLKKGDRYKEIYPEYTKGQITMEELLKETYACWKGLNVSDLPEVYKTFEFNDGAKEAVRAIKERGMKTALLTQIPTHLGSLFQDDLGFDYIAGTVLEVKDGAFTGRILEYHDNKKKEAEKILEKERISPKDAVSIGDRKDDADVFKLVRFGIAYNGDEAAKKAAKYRITDFRELLGIIEKESG
ncbi:MAG: HAD family phosphatase [archaeon]